MNITTCLQTQGHTHAHTLTHTTNNTSQRVCWFDNDDEPARRSPSFIPTGPCDVITRASRRRELEMNRRSVVERRVSRREGALMRRSIHIKTGRLARNPIPASAASTRVHDTSQALGGE